MTNNNYMTVNEAATHLSIQPRTIRQWIKTGTLPAYRIGARSIRINTGDLNNLIQRIN